MILCAWAFLKRKRIKYYVVIINTITPEDAALGFIIDSKAIITDFELTAKIWYQFEDLF